MSTRIEFVPTGDGYWLDLLAVRRWNGASNRNPGCYSVVHLLPDVIAEFFGFYACPHVNAVVDDFGSLVKVTA